MSLLSYFYYGGHYPLTFETTGKTACCDCISQTLFQGKKSFWVLIISFILIVVAVFLADWSRKYLQEKEAQIKENQIKKEQVQKQVEFAKVQTIIQERCVSCHSDKPTFSGIVAPPAGISYDKSEDILLNVEKIYQQVVISKIMPLGNITQMTQEERDVIAQWYINQK